MGTSKQNGYILVFFLGLVLLFLPNCSMVKRFADSSRPYHTPGYAESLEKWSREARIHRGLEVDLILSATFKSRAFRRAYAEEYAAAYKLGAEETMRFLETQMQAADLGHEFLMAVFVPQADWDDFDKTRSMWRIRLIDDRGKRIQPAEIRRIKKKDALTSHFFPHISPWKSVYLVRFSRDTLEGPPTGDTELTEPVTLEVAGVLGSAQLQWP